MTLPVLAIRDAVHFPGLVTTLLVVREPSVRALRKANEANHQVLVLSQRDMSLEDPSPKDLYDVGIVSEALQTLPLPDTSLRVALRGLRRVRAKRIVAKNGCFYAEIEELQELDGEEEETELEAMSRTAIEAFTRVVEQNSEIPPEALEGVVHAVDIGFLADAILHHLPVKPSEKQELLQQLDRSERLRGTVRLLQREGRILELRGKIHQQVERELGDSQREYYLREQLKVIQSELHQREERGGESEEYEQRLASAGLPEEAEERAKTELRRLERSPAASPEAMVIRTYLDALIELPWQRSTEDRLDVNEAHRLLDERHFGLDRVKDRILDHLAVRQLRADAAGSILCFVGPPGVGKTSLGKSIADAMGRRFVRIALGGVRDEAEIRGHRKTYVGSMPGRILQGLRDCGSRNPVIVLDEIDKLGQSSNGGDPMSALLEALDSEQNHRFSDHFIEIPFDLGEVMFIATGNLVENIPGPLRDRMEIISFPGYTESERLEIAKRFLLPRVLLDCGLREEQLSIQEEALVSLVRDYTREAGVRELSRQLLKVGQKTARRIAEGKETQVVVAQDDLCTFLGRSHWSGPQRWQESEVGVAWGLVVSEAGGGLVAVEATLLPTHSSTREVRLTGNLGDVMKESALAAVTFLQSTLAEPLSQEIHIHVPEGGVPKEGPSAGLTVLLALASAHANKPISQGFAVTGEITLRGRVLGVGGIRDKLLAAAAGGITDVILPWDNREDIQDLPAEAKDKLRIHLVRDAHEALALVF